MRLNAALLRSFKGQHGEKMVCISGVPGVSGNFGKANNHLTQIKRGRGRHHTIRPLLIGAALCLSSLNMGYLSRWSLDHYYIYHRTIIVRAMITQCSLQARMDQYFDKINKIIDERKTSSRVRFMMKDVVDLRLVSQCSHYYFKSVSYAVAMG